MVILLLLRILRSDSDREPFLLPLFPIPDGNREPPLSWFIVRFSGPRSSWWSWSRTILSLVLFPELALFPQRHITVSTLCLLSSQTVGGEWRSSVLRGWGVEILHWVTGPLSQCWSSHPIAPATTALRGSPLSIASPTTSLSIRHLWWPPLLLPLRILRILSCPPPPPIIPHRRLSWYKSRTGVIRVIRLDCLAPSNRWPRRAYDCAGRWSP